MFVFISLSIDNISREIIVFKEHFFWDNIQLYNRGIRLVKT